MLIQQAYKKGVQELPKHGLESIPKKDKLSLVSLYILSSRFGDLMSQLGISPNSLATAIARYSLNL